MPEFEYVVKDKQAKSITGVREAATADDLIAWLREHDYLIVRINERKAKVQIFSKSRLSSQRWFWKLLQMKLIVFLITIVFQMAQPLSQIHPS